MGNDDNQLSEISMMFRLPIAMCSGLFLLCATGMLQPAGADQGSDVADRLCSTCHTGEGGLQLSAPPIDEVASRVDWSNVKLREWMATNHRFAPALSANAAELEALRRHLDAIRQDSYLGGLDDLK